jgi:hypothetical protein
MSKTKMFVGSSTESLPVAQILQSQLQYAASVQLWSQGIFGISEYTLDSLLEASREFDFAAFIFSADDTLVSRGKRYLCARDNVALELGLFAGRLGRQRTFIVVQRTREALHLPSDLHGITTAQFDWPLGTKFELSKLHPVLGPVSVSIQTAMEKHGAVEAAIKPLSGGMVFLALCLRARSYTIGELIGPFREFQTYSERISDADAGRAYAEKATKYGCQCLEALGMAESFGGNEFMLSNLGRELLDSEKVQQRHRPTFEVFQKLKQRGR